MPLFSFKKKKKQENPETPSPPSTEEKIVANKDEEMTHQPHPVLMSGLLNINRRLRIIEERYGNVQKQIQFDEQSLLDSKKELYGEIKHIDSEISDLTKEIEDLKEQMEKLVQEVEGCAKREDVVVLQKYLDVWEPLQFITHTEAKKIVQDTVDAIQQGSIKKKK